MLTNEKLIDIQARLKESQLDGWLFYDFRRSNDIACKLLGLPSNTLQTRRWYYFIPKEGKPTKIVHLIENEVLNHLPGERKSYRTWEEIEAYLASVLRGSKKVAMEYSERNAIPYISKVDAGTIDLVRELGIEVVSSANLLQYYTSVLSNQQIQNHLEAAEILSGIAQSTWDFISKALREGNAITEFSVQQFILTQFAKRDCISTDAPVCAVNRNSASPHYTVEQSTALPIQPGDFVLIDLWAKKKIPNAIYADITRVAVAAPFPTSRQQEIFDIVKKAQTAATDFVKKRLSDDKPVMGCEVDYHCRQVIEKAGYGQYFIHRTGHNIDENDHGSGANIDNFETQDFRLLLPGTCFSIEPGIYLPGEFGVRLEYDVLIHPDKKIQITGGIQERIECLL